MSGVARVEVFEAADLASARAAIVDLSPDLVLTDAVLSDGRGVDLIEEWAGREPFPAFIVVTEDGSLENAAVAIEKGASDYVVGSADTDALARAVLFACYRRKRIETLRTLAMFDRLTGLMNRSVLGEAIERERERHRRVGHPFSVAYIDLDRFKPINDRLGHAAGDFSLRSIGDRIRTGVRRLDTPVRLGGDEFVIVLSGAGPVDAAAAARSLLDRIREPIHWNGEILLLEASIGIATCPDDSDDADILLSTADERMYQAKRAGGGMGTP